MVAPRDLGEEEQPLEDLGLEAHGRWEMPSEDPPLESSLVYIQRKPDPSPR